jgi:inositol transport system ATP-binding protein
MALLEITGLCKRFGGVTALDGAALRVAAGEVHALLGENGAGKSTLLKTLAGAQGCDAGDLRFDGALLSPKDTPAQRQAQGIVTIYQEFNLQPFLSVADNMYLGREPTRRGLVDRKRLMRQAQDVLDALELRLDPACPVGRLSVAEQQMVEIARALTLNARLIIMDEPSAALSAREVDILHRLIRRLKARGVAVIYVTHRLKEVMEVCDRYTVLRDGCFVADGEVAQTDIDGLIRLMVGRDVEFARRAAPAAFGEVVLSARGVCSARLRKISFDVRAGEIVGLAGLVGSGRTELARILFGADPKTSGEIWLNGERLDARSPAEALAAGIALVPEDRKTQGCFLTHSVRHNLSLSGLKALSNGLGFIDNKAEAALVERYRQRLRIRMDRDQAAISTLSGGNQQKVLLARCMALSPKALIVDEPTRGVDVGAKAEVHQALFELAAAGVAVILISSELPEVMAVSDRIIVFREGRVTGNIDNHQTDVSEEELMGLMAAEKEDRHG